MEIHQLRYFLAVADTLNFSRAAEKCRVSQPSLSQQIARLEGGLAARLFERTRREVSLTPAGHAFRAHARRVIEELDAARASVEAESGGLRGRVVLGVLPTIAPYHLAPVLSAFARSAPDVSVLVHEDTTSRLLDAIAAREVDLALVSLPIERHGILVEHLFMEDLLVALPVANPLARRRSLGLLDLESENFVLMQEGHCLAGQALQFCGMSGFTPRVGFRSSQIETLLAFVAEGWGVSIVPAMAARCWSRPGIRFRRLDGLQRSVGLLSRAGALRSPASEALRSALRAAPLARHRA